MFHSTFSHSLRKAINLEVYEIFVLQGDNRGECSFFYGIHAFGSLVVKIEAKVISSSQIPVLFNHK